MGGEISSFSDGDGRSINEMYAVLGPLYDPIVESDRDRVCDDPSLGILIGGSAGGTGGKWAASERDVVD